MASILLRAVRAVAAYATGRSRHRYEPIFTPGQGDIDDIPIEQRRKTPSRSYLRRDLVLLVVSILFVFLLGSTVVNFSSAPSTGTSTCDDINDGYICKIEHSHFWGQYSPYYSVPSDISADLPDQCEITFAQILARHGARDPTATKSDMYRDLIDHIQKTSRKFPGAYKFLESYQYKLGAEELTAFGEQQMVNSGIKYYQRYRALAKDNIPFLRSAGQHRVVKSAQNWTQGFHAARAADEAAPVSDGYPYKILVIGEGEKFNNTLSHDTCTNFDITLSWEAQRTWGEIFTRGITRRINKSLRGANLIPEQVVALMDMCPFDTVASPLGSISQFCYLFTAREFQQYDYFQAVGKYWGWAQGNPLGRTQGVGYANELIARMTNTPVIDHTNTNSTLDNAEETFPVNGETRLFADFSHDNDITSIFAALNLYNATKPLSPMNDKLPQNIGGYSASWTVPFAARAYFEKMKCAGQEEEYVRVIVNDRVQPLETCGGDKLGRCTLSNFVDSLSYAQKGGDWDKCSN